MKKTSIIIIISVLCVLLTGCGPKPDNTQPENGYNVDINLPFATNAANGSIEMTTPIPQILTGWSGETIVLDAEEYTTLEQGSIGTKVKNLQKRLIELNYMTGTATGTFDNATTLGVKRFESTYGQAQTGIATPVLQYYLFSETAKLYTGGSNDAVNTNTSVSVTRTLQRGDTGEDVMRLKNRLVELGYMTSAGSNYYDADTENGIKAFESAYNKARTGIATIDMQNYLYSAYVKSVWQIAAEATPVPTPTPTPAPWSAYTQLSKGDSGSAVKNLQNRLKALGYMTGSADGKYGDKTVDAVRAFEAMYGRIPTGVATAELQYYLYDDTARPAWTVTAEPTFAPATYSILSYGDFGDTVVQLQERLIELGYLNDKADGYYGKNTQAAVSAFETANGKTSTGVATALLQEYLFSEKAVSNSTSGETVQDVFTQLGKGSYGADVNSLQQRLKQLGYYNGSISGYFDDATENAVKAFEAAYGRSETGVATVQLQTYLYSENALRNPANGSGNYTALKKGDKGDKVAQLQRRLIELGYLAGTVDGYYGEGTESAVKAFEAANGAPQTGKASAEMQSYLFSSSAISNPSGNVAVSYSTIEKGDTGTAVTALQNRLIELGFLSGNASGKFDAATVNAVKAFQKASGLNQTGVATSALQRELFSAGAANAQTEQLVTVNKKAYVAVAETYYYKSAGDSSPSGTLSKGTEVTIARTKGVWAEIKNSKGDTWYALLEDFTYTKPTTPSTNDKVETVNKQAMVNASSITVYSQPDESSSKMGTISNGTYVTWLRTRGEWAEIQNSKGDTGYVKKNGLTALSSADNPSGSDYENTLTIYTKLSYKDKGTGVKQLQTRLKQLGYFDGDVGGNYLEKTKASVEAFEKAIGLVPTGVATPGLQDILYSQAAPSKGKYAASNTYTFKALSYGSTGESVGELQKRLNELGYLQVAGTKFAAYDEPTAMAVMDVQMAMGLQNVDGIATAELQAFIMSNAAKAIKK